MYTILTNIINKQGTVILFNAIRKFAVHNRMYIEELTVNQNMEAWKSHPIF